MHSTGTSVGSVVPSVVAPQIVPQCTRVARGLFMRTSDFDDGGHCSVRKKRACYLPVKGGVYVHQCPLLFTLKYAMCRATAVTNSSDI